MFQMIDQLDDVDFIATDWAQTETIDYQIILQRDIYQLVNCFCTWLGCCYRKLIKKIIENHFYCQLVLIFIYFFAIYSSRILIEFQIVRLVENC